jgi:RimJ/RimL family protein N-acetyltransferase
MDVTTDRLHIRDLTEEDAEAMHQLRTDPRVYRFNHFGPETPEETQHWVVETMAYNRRPRRDSHNCAIILAATAQVIGWIGFGTSEREQAPAGEVGFGYAIMPEFWNLGYTTEALRATLDFIFSTTAADSAADHCNIGNIASARVMQKAGMHFVTRFANPGETRPEKAASYLYRMTRADWEKNRQPPIVG